MSGRRFVLICGLASTIITASLALVRPGFLASLDYAAYDAIVARGRPNPPGQQVAIVDVDERSLSEIGQWPWRREVIGTLIDRLHDLGATIVALDVVFAEADRHDPLVDAGAVGLGTGGSSASGLSPQDVRLAETLSRGRVVLGYPFTFEPSIAGRGACVLHPLGVALRSREDAELPLFRASGAICIQPVLAQAAGASGFMNAAPDRDGILRRVPLLIELDGRVYPALALAAVAAATNTRDAVLDLVNVNTLSLTLDRRVVPLDGKGNLLVRYRGEKKTFPFTSAANVLGSELPADAFRDKLVFVGATALGTRDVVSTPLDTLFSGVEVQATVADNLLQQDFIRRSEHAVSLETLATLGAGVVVVLLVARTGLLWGGLGALVCAAVLWQGAAQLLSAYGLFLSPVFPTAGVILALASTTVAKVSVERGRVRRAREQDALSRRLMIETLLSLTAVRDAETGSHSRRTQRYARVLAEQLSAHPRFRYYLTPERIDLLATLAPLHDIGKVGVPDRLLNKPGKLTPDELAEMRKHPVYGRDVILQAEHRAGARDDATLTMAMDIVYTHHERWDGTGYPQGLRGEQIPIPGRLVAVVDVYDALVTRRVYRAPMLPGEALDLIAEGLGTHFDPAVVEAFLQVAPVLGATSAEMDV